MARAVFESWRGQFNDSPRRIHECLLAARPDVRSTWVGEDLPAPLHTVRRHSPAHLLSLRRADLFVSNDILTRRLPGSPRGTYLQTWHGTPLKLLGHDERTLAYDGAADHLRRMVRDVAGWDVLLSQSPAATPLLRSAFRFEGPVWECGYPRNDVLADPGAPAVRDAVRRRLGLEETDTAVLWVPTWRDYDTPGSMPLAAALDHRALVSALPPGTVLLARMHRNVTVRPGTLGTSFRDVSSEPDVNALYLASDVLVTDYSSAVFDFAVTRKPVVCFTPDLERYQDTRGLYLDYQAWAPGPVTRTTGDLAAVLHEPAALVREYAARLDEFVATWCPLDDGHAGQRVVDRLLAEGWL